MSQMSQMSQMSLSLSLSLSLSGLKGRSLYVKSKSTVTKSSHMSRMSQMSQMSQVMSSHHSDQMSQRSQVSRVSRSKKKFSLSVFFDSVSTCEPFIEIGSKSNQRNLPSTEIAIHLSPIVRNV